MKFAVYVIALSTLAFMFLAILFVLGSASYSVVRSYLGKKQEGAD